MGMDEGKQWLSYAEAARRVKSSGRTVRNWRRQGMPMEWRVDEGGQRYRVVEESVLLSWWRKKMLASPVHFYKMRRQAIDRGETPPPIPERFRNTRERREQSQIHDRPGEDAPLDQAAVFREFLRDLPEFHGQAEHAALMAAMEDEPPACDGLEVFTRDRYADPEEVAMMRGICRSCPLLDLCHAFAAAGKPTGGMWAGMTPAEIRGGVSNATPKGAISDPTPKRPPRLRVPDPIGTRALPKAV